MTVANKVHEHGLQHHAPSHITMHLYISSCNTNLWKSTVATYVGMYMHGYVGRCMVLQSLFAYFVYHCHPYIFVIL